ncbi:aminodeoxychorismate lyase [Sutcliffiella rhizosphaerae]|uniref:D-alanine aminotransferase n=1 Tax=Sutcliffiella rhizosphaerae TaxID=2880967 RepID=A0ABM8YTX5_9BACI|nr:aminodeoxychorismate lyase [Sutcliffiella rhizosphaerae]CAG9623418.1 D-alanine aminotransferase [Sutcliffiella rhizosphaerae]
MIVYKDGDWKPIEETQVSVMDHGFLYGVGLFETFRTYNGVPFLLKDHLKRLRVGLESVYIDWQEADNDIQALVTEALLRNEVIDGIIRLNVTAGISNWGLPTETYNDPSLLLFTRPVPKSGSDLKAGVFLDLRRNTPEGKTRLKSHHYLNNLLGKRELGSQTDIEGIFLTEEGWIAEGLVSNIFWIKDGTLYTPSLATGILNGVTRQYILHLGMLLGLNIEEGFFAKEDLLFSDTVFFTNSTQELITCKRIGDKEFPNESIWVTRIKELYQESTERQLLSYEQAKKVEMINGKYKLVSN